MVLELSVGQLISLPGCGPGLVAGEAAQLFFVAADTGGDGLDGGVQGGDIGGEPGEGVRGRGPVAVLVDDGAQRGVAVEAGAADALLTEQDR